MPEIPYSPPIEDLFANFQHNWGTLSPALFLLFGILFAFFMAKKIIKIVKGDDDD
jgi:hypothetical protein